MPTQEQINAANVELQIANDSYKQLVDKYNQYQDIFKAYAIASPEAQAKAQGAMQNALKAFGNLKLNMYAAEDRIAQAQGVVNSINEQLTATPSITNIGGQRRRPVVTQPQVAEQAAIEQPEINQPVTYTAPQYSPIQDNMNLQRRTISAPPLYTTYPSQYTNNALRGTERAGGTNGGTLQPAFIGIPSGVGTNGAPQLRRFSS